MLFQSMYSTIPTLEEHVAGPEVYSGNITEYELVMEQMEYDVDPPLYKWA